MRSVLFCCALTIAGCGPHAVALTAPPPGKVADVDDIDCTMAVSKGIALAFECTGRDCEATIDDGSVGDLRRAFINDTSDPLGNPGGDRDVFVLVGASSGRTVIHLEDENGTSDFDVTVSD